VLPVRDVIVPVVSGCDLAARPRSTRTPAENAGDGAPPTAADGARPRGDTGKFPSTGDDPYRSLDEIPGEYGVAKCVDGPEM